MDKPIMPTEAPAVVAEAVAEARAEGVQAGAAVAEAKVEAIAEVAAERVAVAEAAAQAAGDALTMTAIGQRMEALERAQGEGSWQREILSGLQASLAALTAIQTTMAASLGLLTEALVETTDEPSTPENSSQAKPGDSPEHAEDAGGPESRKRSGHRLI
jgi:hypothetical protein